MPIHNFAGDTFVAFIDISGFKQLMSQGNRALRALDLFYSSGYSVLKEYNLNRSKIEGLFISDCGILFARDFGLPEDQLNGLLEVIKQLNVKMIEHDFMLTTSIAYGEFRYQEKIEFEGIGKTPLYGHAYVAAFLDAENGSPKIQPGECRIVKKNLPNDVVFQLCHNEYISDKGANHYYYYWMVQEPSQISLFEKEYKDSYNLKYSGMLKALKSNIYV